MNGVSTGGVIALLLLGYFLGTFPSALIVAKRGGIDVTAEGSGIRARRTSCAYSAGVMAQS